MTAKRIDCVGIDVRKNAASRLKEAPEMGSSADPVRAAIVTAAKPN